MLSFAVVALVALLPIVLLTSHSMPSGVFYGLIVLALTLLGRHRFSGAVAQTRCYGWLIGSYSVLFLSVLASSLYYENWAGANSEGALRLFLGLWTLLLALPYINRNLLRHSFWGVAVAGLVSTAILLWLIVNVDPRPLTPGVILTTYSSVMLLLGAFSVYSLMWRLTAFPVLESGFKILVALATFVGFLAAQTRTGLLGLPLFILLGVVLFVGVQKPRRLMGVLGLCTLILIVSVASSDALRHRIVEGVKEVKTCQGESSTVFTSMCIRIQLWRTAVDAGLTNPWVGLGDGSRYHQYMQDEAVPKGLVSQKVAQSGFGEPHNDLLLAFAGFGFPGALGLLLVYLMPCFYFIPRLLSTSVSNQARAAAAMGVAICLGFALFGLTEMMFRRMNTMGFYVAFVALFMVLSDERSQGETASVKLPPDT